MLRTSLLTMASWLAKRSLQRRLVISPGRLCARLVRSGAGAAIAQFVVLKRYLNGVSERPLLRRVLGSGVWQVSEKLLRAAVSLVIGIWVARYLGSEQFGALNFAIAFVALFSFISELGLQAIVVRELVRRPHDRVAIVESALVLKLIGAVLLMILSVGAVSLWRSGEHRAIVLVGVISLSVIPQAWDAIDFDSQSQLRPRPIVIIRSISLLVFSAVRVYLVLARASLVWFAWVVVWEAVLNAIAMGARWAKSRSLQPGPGASFAEMKSLLAASWPFAISTLSVILYMRIDQVMLGTMLNDQEVGIFSAAVRVSESWYFVPLAALAAVSPALTDAYSKSQEAYNRMFVAFARAMLLLGVLAGFAMTGFSDQIVEFLYGAEYRRAASVLAVHGWAGLFATLGIATAPWFVNSGMLIWRMTHTLCGAVVNMTLNVYLIPRYGVMGAAVATLISYSCAALWFNAFSSKTRPLFYLQVFHLIAPRRVAPGGPSGTHTSTREE
jgi:PST family polysaccharide transporter